MLVLGISFLAGLLSSLSPCVLPVLPFLMSVSTARYRLAPVWLVSGLTVSFSVMGIAVASLSDTAFIDPYWIRVVSAIGMIVFGCFLVFPFFKTLFIRLSAPLMTRLSRHSDQILTTSDGPIGFLTGGMLLGIVWTPCVGPTLGTAVILASSGSIGKALGIMMVYSLGASLPLLGIAYGLQSWIGKQSSRLNRLSLQAHLWFGWSLVLIGLSVFIGLDKLVEQSVLSVLPDVFIHFISRY